jgi:hypothetical protein
MNDVKCSSCSAALSANELHDGWCNSCGQRVPAFVYHQAGLKGPKEKALPRVKTVVAPSNAMDPEERPPVWQLTLIGLAIVGIAAVIVWSFV